MLEGFPFLKIAFLSRAPIFSKWGRACFLFNVQSDTHKTTLMLEALIASLSACNNPKQLYVAVNVTPTLFADVAAIKRRASLYAFKSTRSRSPRSLMSTPIPFCCPCNMKRALAHRPRCQHIPTHGPARYDAPAPLLRNKREQNGEGVKARLGVTTFSRARMLKGGSRLPNVFAQLAACAVCPQLASQVWWLKLAKPTCFT